MGRLIRSSEFDGANNLIQRIEQLYDKANRLKKQSWVIDGDSFSESYAYNDPVVGADAPVRPKDGSLAFVTTATGDTIEFSYDSLKRLNETNIKNSAGNTIYRTGYIYKAGTEANQTTAQIRGFTVWNPDYTNIVSTRYEYDALGNITRIEDGTGAARTLAEYTYDELNQLIQEKIYNYADDSANYTSIDTYVYTYDSAGNILKEEKNGTVVNAYTYSTGPWADQLVAVNGEEITYDGSGNPNIYVSGYGVTYQMGGFDGRNWLGFQTMTGPQLQVAYDYDADGIRTAKCVDGEDHDYVTQNGKYGKSLRQVQLKKCWTLSTITVASPSL